VSGGVWIVSYVLLWVAVAVLGFAVLALLRQVGVLHARLQPLGVHFAGEGPELNRPAPAAGPFPYDAPLTLVAFTSPTCEVCAELRPSMQTLERQYRDVHLVEIESGPATHSTFRAFNVSNTPYFVAVDGDGVVRGRGVANSLEQLEELVEEALA
jgi:methylamine dehydrogenase accessory protein MauD